MHLLQTQRHRLLDEAKQEQTIRGSEGFRLFQAQSIVVHNHDSAANLDLFVEKCRLVDNEEDPEDFVGGELAGVPIACRKEFYLIFAVFLFGQIRKLIRFKLEGLGRN